MTSIAATHKLMDQLLRRVKDVTTLPDVAMRLIRLGNDSTIGAREMVGMVESDPAMSARVLRCVNSAAYALRYRMDSLHRAIAHLGSRAVRSLAITAYVSNVFRQPLNKPPYSRAGLWRHSVSVAVGAKCIASRVGSADPEEAFLGGLLHDIGIILEDQNLHTHFLAVVDRVIEGMPLLDAERQVMNFTHQQLGERLTEMWTFPKTVMKSVAYHHHPSLYRGEDTEVLDCVHLANVLVSSLNITSIGVNFIRGDNVALERLRMGSHDLRVLADDLPGELERHAALIEPP
jgi:putative nucleotidyltransferase with HDIG domain